MIKLNHLISLEQDPFYSETVDIDLWQPWPWHWHVKVFN